MSTKPVVAVILHVNPAPLKKCETMAPKYS